MCRCHDLHCSSLKENRKREMKTIIRGGWDENVSYHASSDEFKCLIPGFLCKFRAQVGDYGL